MDGNRDIGVGWDQSVAFRRNSSNLPFERRKVECVEYRFYPLENSFPSPLLAFISNAKTINVAALQSACLEAGRHVGVPSSGKCFPLSMFLRSLPTDEQT
jgi:hypothetical protein